MKLFHAELLKTKHSAFLYVHLIVPATIAALFIAYYSYTPWHWEGKLIAYFQVLACGLPLMISIVCTMLIEQESSAGHFQLMLTDTRRKITSFLMKAFLACSFGFIALLLAAILFSSGFSAKMPLTFYLGASCILFASSIFLYIFHLVISLQFGRGASIGLGVVGSLLAALLITGLGDTIWPFVPYGWGIRFISHWTLGSLTADVQMAIVVCFVVTASAIVFASIWFWRWQGRNSLD
ncbi:lantibiotic immunity ABC transporter MutG family permease subunit [Lysinibacillus louembei]|uniref:Lantibiotic immunity ABC transporter MutG family permease subunit n=1 Tax=Lysinibacillus louembei TaxID=1470088 RepID=A0ABZ0RX86_9BACI|nr:lantibiotic immunity ABC transporter MutG family permease subunit [Lysinibacillus louembei]WPK12765.1 lantibiotic immunity ABC transporter MutG family permease subunit [Lysinibacillus louembei]